MKAEYEILGVSDDGKKLKVKFKNPFRTASREDNESFADYVRDVNIQFNGTTFDEKATDEVVEQQAAGVYNKMRIAYEKEVIKGKKLEAIFEKYPKLEENNGEEENNESNGQTEENSGSSGTESESSETEREPSAG